MSRSRSRRRATRGQQAHRIPERIQRAHGADPRLAHELELQREFAAEQMRAEFGLDPVSSRRTVEHVDPDLHLPTMLGEPEPLI